MSTLKSIFLLSTLLLFHIFQTHAQTFQWKDTEQRDGFTRKKFVFDGRDGFILEPHQALEGNPWVWRAQFPEWHTTVDSMLLAKGFHVVFINTNDMYGAPKALMVWDKLYQYLTQKLQLAPKVALEAVSRGGLYAYGWAKRNPDKVSCILAEAPVCDLKSWPGGKGKSKGDSSLWKQAQEIYGFKSEKEAIDYNDNPYQNLEGLAAFRIPIMHLISLKDEIVPPEENTFKLIHNYVRLGGQATIVPMNRNKQELEGHHFPIETPEKWANFVYQNSYPVPHPLPNSQYFNLRNGLPHFKKALTEKRTVNVAFLGGSITYNPGWRPKTIQYLKELYPHTTFKFISAGISSLGSFPHAFRLQRDILDSAKIDLLFIECAVNDRANSTDSLTQVQSLEGIVRHAKKTNMATDMIMMAFADPDKNKDFEQHKNPVEIINQELIAQHYQIPSINLAKLVYDKVQHHELSWDYDFKDLHPSAYGQELYFSAIKSLIQNTEHVKNNSPAKWPNAIHKNSFENGRYLNIQNAKNLKNWEIIPKWNATDGKEVREGFFNIPMLQSKTEGGTFELSFEGNTIGMAVLSGPDAGRIRYQIDHDSEQEISTYTQWSSYLHLPWYILLRTGLKTGKHTLKVKLLPQAEPHATGNAVRIAYFLTNK